jgi:hypothetical protein
MNEQQAPLLIKDDVRYRAIAEEGLVLRQDAGEMLVVNGVGMRVLELIGVSPSLSQLLFTLEQEYAVDPAVLREDAMRYLEELRQAGVLAD